MSKTRQSEDVLTWRKSSYSVANGACVETAAVLGAVLVRDMVNPAGGHLLFSARAWRDFTARTKGA